MLAQSSRLPRVSPVADLEPGNQPLTFTVAEWTTPRSGHSSWVVLDADDGEVACQTRFLSAAIDAALILQCCRDGRPVREWLPLKRYGLPYPIAREELP